MEKEKAVIYAVKSGENTCHYIGKTINENSCGDIVKSSVSRAYTNEALMEVFQSHREDLVIEPIKRVDASDWYDQKLQEVVNSYKEDHPLLNAQWMLDGKRGYWEGTGGFWEGKTRDPHTLKRLSESKYIKVCQYDDKGVLLKIWDGAKEAAIEVFGDYSLDATHGKSKLYLATRATTMKSSFRLGYYWFRASDMEKQYGLVPKKLNLAEMLANEKERQRLARLNTVRKPTTHTTRATVIQYNEEGEEIQRFDNTSHAAYELKISFVMVQRFCRGTSYNSNYILGFGPKKLQPMNPKYPKYVINCKKHVKPPKVKMTSRTYREILHYKGEVLLRTYEGMTDAKKKLGFNESKIRRLCETGIVLYNRRLEWGEKKTVLTPVK